MRTLHGRGAMVLDRPPTGRRTRRHRCVPTIRAGWVVGSTIATTPGPRPVTASMAPAAARSRWSVRHAECDRSAGSMPGDRTLVWLLLRSGPALHRQYPAADQPMRGNGTDLHLAIQYSIWLVPRSFSQRPLHFGWTSRSGRCEDERRTPLTGGVVASTAASSSPTVTPCDWRSSRKRPASNRQLIVTLESATRISERARKEAGLLVQKMLGLAIDMQPFYDLARDNAAIGPLVKQFYGVRPPRFPTVFEGLVNSIACQQVTLDLGIVLLNRLSERFGAQVVTQDAVLHAFPTPTDLADVPEESIKELGFSRQKARAIRSSPLISPTPAWTWQGLRARQTGRPLPICRAFAASVDGLRSMCSCEDWAGWTPFRATTLGRRTTYSDCFASPISRTTTTFDS